MPSYRILPNPWGSDVSLAYLDQESKTLHKIIQDHLPEEYNQAMEGSGIGVAEVNSAHYVSLTRLISLADEAMYQDKHQREDAN